MTLESVSCFRFQPDNKAGVDGPDHLEHICLALHHNKNVLHPTTLLTQIWTEFVSRQSFVLIQHCSVEGTPQSTSHGAAVAEFRCWIP